ncbi:hypothetical protein E4T56_gene3680 [Termitomyces sp. T112]|nr:hypothetical protein E4T56_gene3680 [Termitomyces sp. T112]
MTTAGPKTTPRAAGTPLGPCPAITVTAPGRAAHIQLRTVTSEEGEKEVEDVEMNKKTLLAMIAEVELITSDMEVEGGEEFEVAAITMEEDTEEDEGKDIKKVQQWGI